MSLVHSFYCWGATAVILGSTAFFAVFGLENAFHLFTVHRRRDVDTEGTFFIRGQGAEGGFEASLFAVK